jgi:hypothetical protein
MNAKNSLWGCAPRVSLMVADMLHTDLQTQCCRHACVLVWIACCWLHDERAPAAGARACMLADFFGWEARLYLDDQVMLCCIRFQGLYVAEGVIYRLPQVLEAANNLVLRQVAHGDYGLGEKFRGVRYSCLNL